MALEIEYRVGIGQFLAESWRSMLSSEDPPDLSRFSFWFLVVGSWFVVHLSRSRLRTNNQQQ